MPLGVIVTALLLLAAATGVTNAKSLYVITEITSYDFPTPIHAYNIDADGMLTYQTEYGAPFFGSGTIALAVDSFSGQLFITFESSGTILLLAPSLIVFRK